MSDYRSELDAQLRSLGESCARFDAGDRAAALGLAAPLRAIFHMDPTAPPLLSHLGSRYIKLLSTAAKNPKGRPLRYWPALVGWSLDAAQSAFVCVPKLDATRKADHPVSFSFWWDEETIYQHYHVKVRRRDLALSTDARAPGRYPWLADGTPWKATLRPENGPEREILLYGAHLASLRQVAHEVLHSPELLKLAGR
jgi:hypothetical protein